MVDIPKIISYSINVMTLLLSLFNKAILVSDLWISKFVTTIHSPGMLRSSYIAAFVQILDEKITFSYWPVITKHYVIL